MTFAIPAAPAARPPNPKMAAIKAITKKINIQRNIALGLEWKDAITRRKSMPVLILGFGG